MTREEAKAKGLKRYTTGEPCKHGHIAERRTSNGQCIVCAKRAIQRAEAKRPEHYRKMRLARMKQYRKTDESKEKRRAYCAKTQERARELQRRWRLANPDKVYEKWERWRQKNKAARSAAQSARNAAKLQRTPAWADQEAINFFYECRPKGCEVDHIVPLCGEMVSGLHVENNLQWLPAAVNARKNNRFEPYSTSYT